LDPEPYKAEIQALEEILYRDGPPQVADADALEFRSQALLDKLYSQFKLGPPEPLARLENFSAAVSAAGQALTFDPLARQDWIGLWEEARGAVFSPAPWFHVPLRIDAAVDALPLADAALALQRVDADLAALIQSAEAETAPFGDKEINLASLKRDPEDKRPQNAQLLESYRAWAAGWVARVQQIISTLPPFIQMPEPLRDAHRLLVRIGVELKAVPNAGPGLFLMASDPAFNALYLPRKYARDTWLGNVKNWLGQSRQMVKSAQSR
jgi:hypothetical protein